VRQLLLSGVLVDTGERAPIGLNLKVFVYSECVHRLRCYCFCHSTGKRVNRVSRPFNGYIRVFLIVEGGGLTFADDMSGLHRNR
jgi:hypothetical protein